MLVAHSLSFVTKFTILFTKTNLFLSFFIFFVQIAKVLQNLTNKPNYSKEVYMLPLQTFIEENTARMTEFYVELSNVEDFFDQMEIDQYMSMSRRDIQITITLNELYSMQDLLVKNVDVLVRNYYYLLVLIIFIFTCIFFWFFVLFMSVHVLFHSIFLALFLAFCLILFYLLNLFIGT